MFTFISLNFSIVDRINARDVDYSVEFVRQIRVVRYHQNSFVMKHGLHQIHQEVFCGLVQ
jgi:hypothetical protein